MCSANTHRNAACLPAYVFIFIHDNKYLRRRLLGRWPKQTPTGQYWVPYGQVSPVRTGSTQRCKARMRSALAAHSHAFKRWAYHATNNLEQDILDIFAVRDASSTVKDAGALKDDGCRLEEDGCSWKLIAGRRVPTPGREWRECGNDGGGADAGS